MISCTVSVCIHPPGPSWGSGIFSHLRLWVVYIRTVWAPSVPCEKCHLLFLKQSVLANPSAASRPLLAGGWVYRTAHVQGHAVLTHLPRTEVLWGVLFLAPLPKLPWPSHLRSLTMSSLPHPTSPPCPPPASQPILHICPA
jgi:hypothetical protein